MFVVTERHFDWFQFGILVSWGTIGVTRALRFRARGLRVIVTDRQRTFREMLLNGLAAMCLLVWAYEVIAHAWAPGSHAGPAILGRVLFSGVAFKAIGVIVSSMAVLLYAISLRHLGTSWRLGTDHEAPGPLVTSGVYGHTRHPIYVAFDLIFIGTFLVHGQFVFLVLVLVWAPLLHVFMLREERFLIGLHGGAYKDYCHRVGRYFSIHRQ